MTNLNSRSGSFAFVNIWAGLTSVRSVWLYSHANTFWTYDHPLLLIFLPKNIGEIEDGVSMKNI